MKVLLLCKEIYIHSWNRGVKGTVVWVRVVFYRDGLDNWRRLTGSKKTLISIYIFEGVSMKKGENFVQSYWSVVER